MSRRVTIEDVAREAGVSKVTVSYVLNGRGSAARISNVTEERVLAVANTLGYRPNAIARSLSTRRTDTLAVVFQTCTFFTVWSGFTSEVMRGISQACVEEGFDLMLHTKAARNPDEEAAFLCDGRVDGALVLRDENDPTLITLRERGLPCVQFFTHGEGDVPSVDCDNFLGGRLATEHLLGLGHERIGMLCGSPHSVSSNERLRGYRQALADAGLTPPAHGILHAENREADTAAVLDLLRAPDAPTALFVWSDDGALALMTDLRKAGYSIPKDLSLVGFDSLATAELAEPPLTSVHQPIWPMAAEAARMLISLTRGNEPSCRRVVFPPHLDVRASTAPPSFPLTTR